jgi:hypothetical protein
MSGSGQKAEKLGMSTSVSNGLEPHDLDRRSFFFLSPPTRGRAARNGTSRHARPGRSAMGGRRRAVLPASLADLGASAAVRFRPRGGLMKL